jgi:hypothetical protein
MSRSVVRRGTGSHASLRAGDRGDGARREWLEVFPAAESIRTDGVKTPGDGEQDSYRSELAIRILSATTLRGVVGAAKTSPYPPYCGLCLHGYVRGTTGEYN